MLPVLGGVREEADAVALLDGLLEQIREPGDEALEVAPAAVACGDRHVPSVTVTVSSERAANRAAQLIDRQADVQVEEMPPFDFLAAEPP